MRSTNARLVAIALAAAAASIATPVRSSAQEPVTFAHPEADRFPPKTVVARYAIDAAALEGVTTSAELVAALREHLRIEAAMPLDDPLWVTIQAAVQSRGAPAPYSFLSSDIGFALAGGSTVASDLASVIRASHEAETFSDWEEEAAWGALLEAIETGLADPASPLAWTNSLRPRNEEGHVELGIAAVHQLPLEGMKFWEVAESLERDYLELRPDASFQSASIAGEEPPADLAHETVGLLIELDPAPEIPPPPTVELPAEVLERYVGRYEYQPGMYVDVRREGEELVMSTSGEGADDEESVITPSSETEFWTKHNGDLVTVSFEVGEDGRVESLTMVQAGFTMTLPRVP